MATTWVERLTRSVHEVLQDRDALEAFKRWASVDEVRCVSSIDLHFAIKQFRTVMERKPVEGPSIAVLAHKKYISKKTGTCTFLPEATRSEMSRRAHAIKNGPPTRDFFDVVVPPLEEHLRRLHASFVCSEVFFTLMKEINAALEAATPSTSAGTPAAIKKERTSSLLAASASSPSTSFTSSPAAAAAAAAASSGPLKSSSPFPFVHHGAAGRVAALASATISSGFNPFRTYTIDGVKQEPIDVDAAIASKQQDDPSLSFADKLGGKLQRLADEMEKRGVQFARDLSGKGDNFADLTEEAIDKDIDDYADRMDARGKSGTKRSTSGSPPSLPLTSPPLAPPSLYGKNGFAPPPSNRLRRKYMETMQQQHNTTAASSGYSSHAPHAAAQASPTAGTSSKKGRPSMDHDSSSSGFYSGLPSSSSSAFSSHFSAPHFNTLRRPTHGSGHGDLNTPPAFPTLARPSFVAEQPSCFSASSPSGAPFFHLLTPGASPSHHHHHHERAERERAIEGRLHQGFATLPRPSGRVPSAPGSAASSAGSAGRPDGKILLRVTVAGNRPMVFRTEPAPGGMTLKQFRTIFGIGKEKNKFFFKNYSEEEPADYQWELVGDDTATVPLYHGSITAECRPALDSPE